MYKGNKKEEEVLNGACPRRMDWLRHLTGELDPARREEMEQHAATCTRCSELRSELLEERRAFLERHPAEKWVPRLEERADTSPGRGPVIWLLPGAAVAALAVLLLVFVLPGGNKPATRTKGAVSLGFYVQMGKGAVQGHSGDVLGEKDRIQFTYTSGANRYIFLVSLDDAGRIFNFNHRGAEKSVAITAGSKRVLEGSIILDASRVPERVFAVFSKEPLGFEEVKAAAANAYRNLQEKGRSVRSLESLPLDEPQASVLINKR